MDFNEFREVSKRTMRFSPEHRANAALGLVGELGEYLTPGENKYEEAGDALFYHGWLCEFYAITPTIKRDFYQQDDLLMSAAAIADMVKKEVFHDKPINREVLAEHLSDIWSFFVNNYGGFTLSDIYKANITKLRKRYPDGFSAERSINRAD